MSPRPLFRAALAALVTAPWPVATAAAQEAAAATSLNVRSGPGTRYSVVDVLSPGELVDVTECQPNLWCQIARDGPDGWVSSSYLTVPPGAARPGSDCRFQVTVAADGTRFGVVCTGGDVQPIGAASGS